ncbi:MAG TPA: efflux RND transporter permease subunit [Longimicrobium sp.]|nr:efflux RND transporter permease subunit [Longimicrobium sp.]
MSDIHPHGTPDVPGPDSAGRASSEIPSTETTSSETASDETVSSDAVEARKTRGLATLAINRPVGTVMLSLVVVVLGMFYLGRLPLDLLPSIVYPQIRAGVSYPGVEPEVLEETVARPLETALAPTEGVTRIETEVQEGRVGVNLVFDYGTDIDLALSEASKNLERARSQLPEEANPPTIGKFDPAQSPIFEGAFSSQERPLAELRDWVDRRLVPQLLTIQGVAAVDVSGGLTREVQVVLDPERLRSYGLTVSQVNDALRNANQDVAAGRVQSTTREVVGVTEGKFKSVNDIRSLVLSLPSGGRVPLTEVAVVRDTTREQRLWVRLNGVPAVKISVRKQPDANTVAVAEAVEERLTRLQGTNFLPSGVQFRAIESQATFIRNSVKSVQDAAVGGALLSMIVIFLFLGSLRKTLVIALSIPLSLLATFVMMGMGGLTLNIMSLGGLALGVGLLLDNAIVMLENVYRRRDALGEDAETAAHRGAKEVTSAVVASTTTNLAAVVPFLLITGLTALIFKELILTISFAILASLPVALTLVPMLAHQLTRIGWSSRLGESRPLVAFDRGMDRLRRGYVRAAQVAVRFRWATLGAAVVALLAMIPLTSNLGNEFLPQVDDGNVSVFVGLPPGSSAAETNRVTNEVEQMVKQMPHVRNVFTTAGGMLFGGSTAEIGGRGSMTITLAPPGERDISADAWVQQMQAKINERGFPGARVFVRPPRIRGLRTNNAGTDVAVTITGDDLQELAALGEEVTERLEGVPGLQNMEPSAEEASPRISIRLDPQRASYLGLNAGAVGQTVRTALDGAVPTRYTEGNREYDVRVMFDRERFTSPEVLGAIALFPGGAAGTGPVYLRDVADVRMGVGPTTVLRENQNRILRITGDVSTDETTVGEVNEEIRKRLQGLELPEGYGLIYGGEEEAIRENSRQLLIVTLLAIFLVFVVLAVQYESLINPIVILLAIPLSLVGVGLALWITQTPMSAPVLLGVILLAGVVVNNSILLVEFIEEFRRDEGASMQEAAVQAGSVRLRPILMTTLTSFLGMLPLAIGMGEGSELMRPLAVAMCGGVLVSTLLTLFVVPSAYVILNGGAERLGAFITRKPPRPVPSTKPASVAGD